MKSKNRKLFLVQYALTPYEKIPACAILTQDDMIIGVGGESSFSKDESGLEVYDMRDCYALPGFIDSHVHGIGQYDAGRDGCSELDQVRCELVRHGVTTFCPTFVSAPREKLLNLVSAIRLKPDVDDVPGASIVGVHLEGPFINPEKRGSQNAQFIQDKIDLGFAEELFQEGTGHIKIMTFAPELDHSVKLVEKMLEHGILPSMGHSLADYGDAIRCVEAGAQRCTYIFNGMPPLHHREPSMTTVALLDDRVSVEIICDGVHIHPEFVDLTARCKPKDKIIGISNNVAADPTQQSVAVENTDSGTVVKTTGGVITGATLTMENAWGHMIRYTHLNELDAACCFTINPAKNLGLLFRGRLYPNRLADIIFFEKNTNKLKMTVIKGEIVYRDRL